MVIVFIEIRYLYIEIPFGNFEFRFLINLQIEMISLGDSRKSAKIKRDGRLVIN